MRLRTLKAITLRGVRVTAGELIDEADPAIVQHLKAIRAVEAAADSAAGKGKGRRKAKSADQPELGVDGADAPVEAEGSAGAGAEASAGSE